ncbi:MAG: hypothetical protein AAF065_02160 [Verrucomicrobiota bacterium]
MAPDASTLDWERDQAIVSRMPTVSEENFKYYKKAETKALEILAEMKATTPKKMNIELSLLVAIFELHKGELPAEAIGKIVGK